MDLEKFIEVYDFAKEAHGTQKRKSEEPYITHPLAVANIAHSYDADEPTIYACLLHDVVEDTEYTLEHIRERFGGLVSFLVDGVTKENTLEATMTKVRKYSCKDRRVILIKMADRLHNLMRGVDPADKSKILINMKKYDISTNVYVEIGKDCRYDKLARTVEEELINLNQKLRS